MRTSDNRLYNGWQRMKKSGTTITTSDNERQWEWQRVTKNDIEWQRMGQCGKTSENK